MKKIFALLLAAMSLSAMAQDPNYSEWTAAEASKANTCKAVQEMSSMEREVVYLMNLARLNGTKFWNTYLANELKGQSGTYVSSLKTDLAKTKNLPMLNPDAGLLEAAKYHASDMAKNNFFDHTSHDGTSCFNRLKRYYSSGNCAENISAGKSTAIGVVAQLLVDQGLASLGHRKTILNASYNAVGVSCGTHGTYSYCCVQDFGDKVLRKPSSSNGGGGSSQTDKDRNSNNGGGGKPNQGGGYQGGGQGGYQGGGQGGGRSNHGGGYHGGGRSNHGGYGRGDYGGRGSSNGRRTAPRFPDYDDDAWEYDDEDGYWYIEDGDYVYILFDDDEIPPIYYDDRTEEFYGWDEDSERWEQIDFDDFDY